MKEARTYWLLGHPVAHSRSPAIHGAVYRHLDLPYTYELRDCATESSVAAAVEALRLDRVQGINVTVPWKRLARRLADESAATAERTGAANVLVRSPSGRVVAHNTDAGALAERLRAGCDEAARRSCVVLGNGGAALAAVVAAFEAGFDTVTVSARKFTGPAAIWPDLEDWLRLGARPAEWGAGSASLRSAMVSADAIVQASSAGMAGVGGGQGVVEVIPWRELVPSVFCYDVVYSPPLTPFLQNAIDHGLAHEGGLSMLVGQAALAIELWLGVPAPREVMASAAQRALAGSQ